MSSRIAGAEASVVDGTSITDAPGSKESSDRTARVTGTLDPLVEATFVLESGGAPRLVDAPLLFRADDPTGESPAPATPAQASWSADMETARETELREGNVSEALDAYRNVLLRAPGVQQRVETLMAN